MSKTIPKGHGPIDELAQRTGLDRWRLYRLRAAGVFKPSRRLNARAVYYDLALCAKQIERYARNV